MLIVLVAAFNIISTLIMVVTDKTREIGFCARWGCAHPRFVGFLCAGTGDWRRRNDDGAFIGLVVSVPDRRERSSSALDPSVYFIDHLPISTQPVDVTLIVARESGGGGRRDHLSRTTSGAAVPVEAIRHE